MFSSFLVNVRRNELEKPFFSLNTASLFYAFENLSKDAFRVYLYLANNRKDSQIILSEFTAISYLGITEECFDSALAELKEKRYLIQLRDSYNFYEVPLSESEAKSIIEKNSKPINLLDLGF